MLSNDFFGLKIKFCWTTIICVHDLDDCMRQCRLALCSFIASNRQQLAFCRASKHETMHFLISFKSIIIVTKQKAGAGHQVTALDKASQQVLVENKSFQSGSFEV